MCRLMYLPGGVRPPKVILGRWLSALEKSNGGHGNGFATVKGGAVKGVELSPTACSDELIRLRKSATVWHTRLISCGRRIDLLCHPFETSNGSYLVHNGHWSYGAYTARLLNGDWSDTAVAALHIRIHGWDDFVSRCDSGVWIHLTPKGRQVLYRSGSLMIERNTGALCSEAYSEWGVWDEVEFGEYGIGKKVAVRHQDEPSEDVWDMLIRDKPYSSRRGRS